MDDVLIGTNQAWAGKWPHSHFSFVTLVTLCSTPSPSFVWTSVQRAVASKDRQLSRVSLETIQLSAPIIPESAPRNAVLPLIAKITS